MQNATNNLRLFKFKGDIKILCHAGRQDIRTVRSAMVGVGANDNDESGIWYFEQIIVAATKTTTTTTSCAKANIF